MGESGSAGRRTGAVLRVGAGVDWRHATYVGRVNPRVPRDVPGGDGRFANPFVVAGTDGAARYEAVERFAHWGVSDDGRARTLRSHLGELVGRDLVCWCAPQRCHAEVLALLVGGEEDRIVDLLEALRDELVPRALF